MSKNRHSMRYMLIAVLFCLVCVIYLGRLFYIQISGRENTYDSGTTRRTVTLQAVRGEIYDRNGRALVSNRYTYDLTFSHEVTSQMTPALRNRVYLRALQGLAACGESEKHEERFFPFEGSYPNYRLSAAAEDGDSVIYYRLQRVLSDLGLEEDGGAPALPEHYVKLHALTATDAAGRRLYTDGQIDLLIRLYYDMDAVRFASAGEYVLAEDVSLALMTYVKEQGADGVSFTVNVERVYNYPGYASHLLGTVGPIYSEEWDYYNEQGYQMNAIVGKTGCESAFESYLRGTDGLMTIEEDAAGNVVSVEIKRAPISGNDVYLTIDIDLQIAAEEGLRENVEYVVEHSGGQVELGAGCNAGAVVAMDPRTFEVLVMASYPTYDLSTYNLDYSDLLANPANPLLNRALGGRYAPGSTYKLGVAAAALMEGEITAGSTIACNGKYTVYPDYQPKCATYGSTHAGHIGVKRAIAISCNCFFYTLGDRMGIDTMNRYMAAFGIGQTTGFELGGERGVLAGPDYRQEINHPEEWGPGLTLQAAIGQSDNLVTPLQLACYVSTLVGGGTRYSAHLLDSVCSFSSGETLFSYRQSEETTLSRTEIPESVRATVCEGMRDVVTSSSTVQRLLGVSELPVKVGGKTGTAQNSSGCDNALFVCTADYENPELVISVVLEQGYAGSYASLTAGRILEAYYAEETD